LRSHCVSFIRLPGVTVGYYLRVFAFYVKCLPVAGVSQPSSNVARNFEFHKGFKVIRCFLGSSGKSGEPDPTILNKVQVAFLSAFLSRVLELADEISYLPTKQ